MFPIFRWKTKTFEKVFLFNAYIQVPQTNRLITGTTPKISAFSMLYQRFNLFLVIVEGVASLPAFPNFVNLNLTLLVAEDKVLVIGYRNEAFDLVFLFANCKHLSHDFSSLALDHFGFLTPPDDEKLLSYHVFDAVSLVPDGFVLEKSGELAFLDLKFETGWELGLSYIGFDFERDLVNYLLGDTYR